MSKGRINDCIHKDKPHHIGGLCRNCYSKKYMKDHWNVYQYNKYRVRSKKKNLSFLFSKEEFFELLDSKCHYCGEESKLGIDRKDNELGYTLDNSVPCCRDCNYFKGSLSYEEFINFCNKVSKYTGSTEGG